MNASAVVPSTPLPRDTAFEVRRFLASYVFVTTVPAWSVVVATLPFASKVYDAESESG